LSRIKTCSLKIPATPVAEACYPVLKAEVVIFQRSGAMKDSGVQWARVGFIRARVPYFFGIAKTIVVFIIFCKLSASLICKTAAVFFIVKHMLVQALSLAAQK
jgi:hypothetical protein